MVHTWVVITCAVATVSLNVFSPQRKKKSSGIENGMGSLMIVAIIKMTTVTLGTTGGG